MRAAAFAGKRGVIVVRKDGSVENFTLPSVPPEGGGEIDIEVRPPDGFRPTELEVSRNGRLAMAVNREGKVVLWSDRAKRKPEFKLNGQLLAAAFTLDGKQLITAANEQSVTIHDLASNRSARKAEESEKYTIQALDVSPDGHLLVAGDEDGVVRFWDLSGDDEDGTLDRRLTLELEGEPVVGVAFTPDGEEVLVTTEGGATRRWPVRWKDRYRLARKLVGKGPAPEVVRSALGSTTRSDVFAALAPDASDSTTPQSDALPLAAGTVGAATSGGQTRTHQETE